MSRPRKSDRSASSRKREAPSSTMQTPKAPAPERERDALASQGGEAAEREVVSVPAATVLDEEAGRGAAVETVRDEEAGRGEVVAAVREAEAGRGEVVA